MNFRSERKRTRMEVMMDITPLIDVVFQLIIFFALSSTFVTSRLSPQGIDVELPRATSAQTQAAVMDLVIAVTSKGEIVFQNRSMNLKELSGLMESEFQRNPKNVVIIQADQDVPHGMVVSVMDAARTAGFTRLAIATQKE